MQVFASSAKASGAARNLVGQKLGTLFVFGLLNFDHRIL